MNLNGWHKSLNVKRFEAFAACYTAGCFLSSSSCCFFYFRSIFSSFFFDILMIHFSFALSNLRSHFLFLFLPSTTREMKIFHGIIFHILRRKSCHGEDDKYPEDPKRCRGEKNGNLFSVLEDFLHIFHLRGLSSSSVTKSNRGNIYLIELEIAKNGSKKKGLKVDLSELESSFWQTFSLLFMLSIFSIKCKWIVCANFLFFIILLLLFIVGLFDCFFTQSVEGAKLCALRGWKISTVNSLTSRFNWYFMFTAQQQGRQNKCRT